MKCEGEFQLYVVRAGGDCLSSLLTTVMSCELTQAPIVLRILCSLIRVGMRDGHSCREAVERLSKQVQSTRCCSFCFHD